MQEVESEASTLKQAAHVLWRDKISLENPKHFMLELVEQRAELKDSRFNLMELWPAKKISFLNFSENVVEDSFFNPFPTSFGFSLVLSSKVTIQKRSVYDALMMFGDVGGLRDFLAVGLSAIFTFFADRMMLTSLVNKVFHVSTALKVPVPITTNSVDQAHRQVGMAMKSV